MAMKVAIIPKYMTVKNKKERTRQYIEKIFILFHMPPKKYKKEKENHYGK